MLINCLDQFVNNRNNLCKGINKMLKEHESIPFLIAEEEVNISKKYIFKLKHFIFSSILLLE